MKPTANYFEVRELTDEEWLAMPKEEILQLYKNCYKMLMDFYKGNLSAFEQFKSQSSPQPQPGRGAEDGEIQSFVNKIGTEYRKVNGMSFIEICDYVKNWMEEYRTQSEGKDMYPKEFVEWIGENCFKYDNDENGWIIITNESHDIEIGNTNQLFNHWSSNHK